MTEYSYSFIKIFKHIHKLDNIKNGIITSPISIRIKPTNKCNNYCFYCSYMDKEDMYDRGETYVFNKNDELPKEVFNQLINDIIDMKIKSVIFSGGGEPLLYKNIIDIIKPLYDNDIDIGFITNGYLLSGKIARALTISEWIRISMDSSNADTYAKIRNVPKKFFHVVEDNIKNFIQIKDKHCEFGINFVINHMNYNEIYESAIYFKNLGLDHIKYYPAVMTDTPNYHKQFRDKVKDDLIRAKDELEDESFKIIDVYGIEGIDICSKFYRSYSNCPIIQIIPAIGADSWVYLCHDKAYMVDGRIGNLKEKSFKEIWYSDETKKLFKEFDAKVMCNQHCAYDQRNIIINEYLNLDKSNPNFI